MAIELDDVKKWLQTAHDKSQANIARDKANPQRFNPAPAGTKGSVAKLPGESFSAYQNRMHERLYPGHRTAAGEAGVSGIGKFFSPEHKKWIASNREKMTWLPESQKKYYSEDWKRLISGRGQSADDNSFLNIYPGEGPRSVRGERLDIGPVRVDRSIPMRPGPQTIRDMAGGYARPRTSYPWSAGQMSLPPPKNAQVTVTDVVGQPSKTVTKYELEDPANASPLWSMRGINRTSPSALPAPQLSGVRDVTPGIYSPMQVGGDARLAERLYGRRQQLPNNLYSRDEFGRIPTSTGYKYSDPVQTRHNIHNSRFTPMPGPMVGGQSGTAEENLYRRNMGLSGVTTPLPYTPPVQGYPTFHPRAESMREHYENNPEMTMYNRRSWSPW